MVFFRRAVPHEEHPQLYRAIRTRPAALDTSCRTSPGHITIAFDKNTLFTSCKMHRELDIPTHAQTTTFAPFPPHFSAKRYPAFLTLRSVVQLLHGTSLLPLLDRTCFGRIQRLSPVLVPTVVQPSRRIYPERRTVSLLSSYWAPNPIVVAECVLLSRTPPKRLGEAPMHIRHLWGLSMSDEPHDRMWGQGIELMR